MTVFLLVDEEQSNLLNAILNFNSEVTPRSNEDKEKTIKAFGTANAI